MRPSLFAITSMIGLLLTAEESGGQTVTGRARAGSPAAPVPGALVLLVDTAGRSVAGALTTGLGTYRLTAPGAGRYRLRALRIGYRPTLTDAFTLVVGTVLDKPIIISNEAISLSSVAVTAQQPCAGQRDSTTAAFAVWAEARKALEAAIRTREAAYLMEVRRFERRLSPGGENVESESEADSRGPSSRPFTSVPAGDIDSAGYVVSDAQGGTYTYRAPDEAVLLSEQFAETHCLRIVQADSADEVAIAFEPTPGRSVPDIQGSITLTRASAALRRVEFRYANVPRAVEVAGAGGQLSFRRLPEGGWFVERWLLRVPVFRRTSSQQITRLSEIGTGVMRTTEHTTVVAFLEIGGEVTEVVAGGVTMWSVPRPTLSGRVQGTDGAPIAGAMVRLPFLQRSATTDSAGRFQLLRVPRGRRQVHIAWPLTDSLGLAPLVRDADSRLGDAVALVVPLRDALLASACNLPARESSASRGMVRGVSRGPTGERVGSARVTVSWYDGSGSGAGSPTVLTQQTLSTVSSVSGDYTICGVPVEHALLLRGTVGSRTGAAMSAGLQRDRRIVLQDVVVHPEQSPP